MTKPFIPSSRLLLAQIAAAEAKFEAAREQARLRKEAQDAARRVRAETNAAKSRFYRGIQLGFVALALAACSPPPAPINYATAYACPEPDPAQPNCRVPR